MTRQSVTGTTASTCSWNCQWASGCQDRPHVVTCQSPLLYGLSRLHYHRMQQDPGSTDNETHAHVRTRARACTYTHARAPALSCIITRRNWQNPSNSHLCQVVKDERARPDPPVESVAHEPVDHPHQQGRHSLDWARHLDAGPSGLQDPQPLPIQFKALQGGAEGGNEKWFLSSDRLIK